MSAVLGAAMMMTIGVAGPASSAPATRLPDAQLWADGQLVADATEWVVMPKAGTLWITEGDWAGHYVIIDSVHLFYPEVYLEEPPLVIDVDPTRFFGKKTGLEPIDVVVLSRFGTPEEPMMSVVGPITIAKVSG